MSDIRASIRMTITEFLEARIAEDEAEAREMGLREWSDGAWSDEHEAKILAECKAKRAILEDHGYAATNSCALNPEHSHSCDHGLGFQPHDEAVSAFKILTNMAAVYKGHPDYDPQWSI
jgi:hypothetical protein